MNDIERLFKEKLHHHQVPPPTDTWEKLQESWQQEGKKKARWWWMAASIALLLMLGSVLYLGQDHPLSSHRVAIDLPADPMPIEPPSLTVPATGNHASEDQMLATPDVETTSKEDEEVPKATVPSGANPAITFRNSVAETVRPTDPLDKVVATRPGEKERFAPPISELPNAPQLAEATMDVTAKPSVTIIYRSGSGDSEQEIETKKPLEKAMTFLTNIKENGVGFSELRSAKSELLSKAFSTKREPMPAE